MPKNKTLLFVFKYLPARSIKMRPIFVCMRTYMSVPYSMMSAAVADECKFSRFFSSFHHTYTGTRDILDNLKQTERQEAKLFLYFLFMKIDLHHIDVLDLVRE